MFGVICDGREVEGAKENVYKIIVRPVMGIDPR